MPVASSPGMKRSLAVLGLLALGGCGTIHNLGTGPQVYGGVRHDVHQMSQVCKGVPYVFDVPFSAMLDTGLLPVTALLEGIRCATGWPPAENFR